MGKVSEYFSKRHADILRKIENMDCSKEFTERNFALSEYKDSTGRMLPIFEMTKDGFMFLVMGFTGKAAAQIKEAYINAFNKMALALQNKSQPKALPEALTPAMQRHIQKRVNEMTLAGNGLSFPQVYGRIKNEFHVGTYKDIPAKKYPELCRFLNCKPEPSALQGELLERETLPAATGNVNIPGNGRWLVIMENGNATVRDIHDKSVVDFQLHRKLQHDAMYASAMLSELSRRLRITSGECSASEFNVSLEDKFNA
ncbi:MAG: Rha family transcriptional regulator [Rheinheimera sp.]|nr:Rha family transcriptional regulator [Rheinheimera sp.]